jgi:hypothetical protein
MMVRSWFSPTRRWGSRKPSVEIHIPISPTPAFFNMVQCLALSIRKFGGMCRDAPIILTVGDSVIDPTIEARYRWLGPLGVELRWVPEPFFREYSYYATGATRLMHDFRSDLVLLLDADILVADQFDELIRRTHRERHVAGMIGPASPLQFFDPPTTWPAIYGHCGVEQPASLPHEHPGWPYYRSGDVAYRYGPAYFNYGVICAPSAMITQISQSYFSYMLKLRELTGSDLIGQIALTMAIDHLGLPTRALPVRYNFPNHPFMEALHGGEIARAKLLHLKETHQFEKFDLFADLANVRATTRRNDLRGINELARRVLQAIEPDLIDPSPALVAA